MSARVEKVVTSGVFSLDGEDFDVDNNVWLVGDDAEVLVIDAAHDADAIAGAIGDRRVVAIVCTHAHNDHVNAAPELARRTGVRVLLHPDDRVLWELAHPRSRPDGDLSDGQVIAVAGTTLRVLHTPGHAPGAVCLYVPGLRTVFSGDTLFDGGPGATGRSYSSRPLLEQSIRTELFSLDDDVVVHTGHGTDTTIGAERARSASW